MRHRMAGAQRSSASNPRRRARSGFVSHSGTVAPPRRPALRRAVDGTDGSRHHGRTRSRPRRTSPMRSSSLSNDWTDARSPRSCATWSRSATRSKCAAIGGWFVWNGPLPALLVGGGRGPCRSWRCSDSRAARERRISCVSSSRCAHPPTCTTRRKGSGRRRRSCSRAWHRGIPTSNRASRAVRLPYPIDPGATVYVCGSPHSWTRRRACDGTRLPVERDPHERFDPTG